MRVNSEASGLAFARVRANGTDALEITEHDNEDDAWYISKDDAMEIARWIISEFGNNLMGAN